MPTYEQAIRCPRCGKVGLAVAKLIPQEIGTRQVTCGCTDMACSYYDRRWFLLVNALNEVTYHSHTVYEETAT